MRHSFARNMERQANKLAEELDSRSIFGTKCWSSSASLFEKSADRVFIGANPGGDRSSQELDEREGYLDRPYKSQNYNAFLDDTWLGKGPRHQRAVESAFKAMYDGIWEETLRSTPCFNVVPFRTPTTKSVTRKAWSTGMKWFPIVLEHLSPSLILCNGSGNNFSAWSAIKGLYSITKIREQSIGANAFVKTGYVQTGSLRGSKVVGIPHLARLGRDSLYEALESLKPLD